MKHSKSKRRRVSEHPDIEFAKDVAVLVIEAAIQAGYCKGIPEQLSRGIRLTLKHPVRADLVVGLGNVKTPDGKWIIRKRRHWRKAYCRLHAEIFRGLLPAGLYPICNVCGRVHR